MTLYLPDADDWLERLGLLVLWRNLDELDEIVNPPVIMLRADASPREQRWMTFHAIAHTRLHRGNQLYMLRRGERSRLAKQERQADVWTAGLLLPRDQLVERVSDGLDFEELAEYFDVPSARVELAIDALGYGSAPAADGTEVAVSGVSDRAIIPSPSEIDHYLRNKDWIDREARLGGWKPGKF